MKAVQHNWYGIKASAFPISHSVLLSASMHQSAAGVAVMRVLLMTVSMAFILAGLQTLHVQTAFAVSVGVCVPLSSNSFCSDILSSSYRLSVYIPTDVSIAISYWTNGNVSDVCQSSADELIGSVAPTVWSAVEADSSCMNSLAKYFCALSYPTCKYTNNATLVAAAGNPPKLAIPSFPNSTECMNTFNSCKAYAPFLSMFPAVIGALFTNPLQTCGASTYPVNLLATSLPTVIQEAIETAVIPFEDFIPQNVPRPQCVRFNSTSCGELIDYEIYQPAQLSTQFNELAPALMDAKLEQFSYLYYTATVATNCLTAMKKQLCTRSFLRCQRTVIQNSFGVAIATAVNELTTGPIPPTAQNISAAITELATLLQQLAVPVSALQVPFPMLPCQTTCTYFNDAACPQFIQNLKASTTSPLESQVLSAALGTNCSSVGTYLQATQQCGSSNGNSQILFPAQPDFPDSTSLLAAPLVLSVSLQFAAAVGVPVAVLNLTQPIQLPISLMSQCNDVGIHLQFGATVTNLSAYSDSQPIQISVVCPPPLVNWDSSDCAINGGSCALPCPLPIFSPSEMVSISRVYVVCIFVSLVSSTFFVVTWLLFHEKRKQTYVINFAIIAWILAFEKTISIYEVNGHIDDMMKIGCKNNCQSWGFGEHAYCTFQGVMSHILVISLSCWFCVLSADLWLKVRLNFRGTQRQNEVKNILAFAVGYGTSFITLIIALGLREFGATGTLPFCFASTASGDVDIATAYAPSLFMCLLGFCFMADVLYLLFRNAMNMTSTQSGGKRVSRWSVHLRPLFFQFQVLCILLFFEADRFWNVQYASDIERETATWVRCLLSGGSTDSCGEVPDTEKPNRPLYYLVVIAAGGIGAIASFTHCTNPDVYRLWYALLFRCETNTVFGGSKHSRSSSHTNLKDANSTNTPKKSITVNQTSNASIRARGPSGLELGQTTVVPVSVGNTPNVLTPVNARGSKNNPHSHNLELKSSDSTQQQPWQLPAVQDDMKIVRQQLRRTGPSSVTVLQDTAVVRSSLPSPVPLSADLAGGVVSGVKNRNEAVRVSTSQTSPKNHI